MKKLRTIITMLALILCSMYSTAQIQNEFLGCTIGSTSKEEAIKKFNAQNLSIESQGSWILVKNANYKDYNWGRIGFKFESDICTKVMFLEPLKISTLEKYKGNPDLLEIKRTQDMIWKETVFKEVLNSLLGKYQKCLTSRDDQGHSYEFDDGKTMIMYSTHDDMSMVLTFMVK